MNSKYPKMNLKYTEKEEIDELSELYLRICESGDRDTYSFIRFYFYLINYRVENETSNEFPICSENIWPYLNRGKIALKKLIYENNSKEYNDVKKYILDVFDKENVKFLENVNKEFFELSEKISHSKYMRLDHEISKEFSESEPEFGIDFNGVYMSLEIIRLRSYGINVMKEILNEEKREKRNFWLGILLGATGMLASIVFGILPFI